MVFEVQLPLMNLGGTELIGRAAKVSCKMSDGSHDGVGLRPYVSEMQRVVEKTINHRAKHEEPGSTPVPKEPVTV